MSDLSQTDLGANENRAARQRLVAIGAIGLVVAGAMAYIFMGSQSPEDRARQAAQKTRLTAIDPRDAEAEWVTGGEARLKSIEEALEGISARLNAPVTGITVETAREIEDLRAQNLRLQSNLDTLSRRLMTRPPTPAPAGTAQRPEGGGGVVSQTPTLPSPASRRSAEILRFSPQDGSGGGEAQFEPISFQTPGSGAPILAPSETPQGLTRSDPRDYVPTNAYAPATFLVTVDMPAGSEDASDPLPVMLRITGPARSALQDGAPLETDLEGCLVNGAATPDLSSERVHVRLQRMTCQRADGEVVETMVEGYVAQFGKAGVRGRVIRREGAFIKQALLASLIGGFGEGLSANAELAFTPYGGSGDRELSTGDIVRGGVGQGFASAADRVADFLIEEAEEYDSVIELPAGIAVELVFVSGAVVRDVTEAPQ